MSERDTIAKASLHWGPSDRSDGPFASALRSTTYNDIYFAEDGLAEARHVFLEGNALAQRFQNAQRFTIGELGFGTGLNIFAACALWRQCAAGERARLELLSFEKHPLSKDEIRRALAEFGGLAPFIDAICANPAPRHPGFHRVALAADIALTLYYGDAARGLAKSSARVDAWFLDGFAPAKNPAMWRPEIFQQMARLSAPKASFATFTVAGDVRRAAEAAGFQVKKRPGFGKKREMLTGRLSAAPKASSLTPWFEPEPGAPLAPGAMVAVIGAGIAGASLAHALRGAGLEPVLIDDQGAGSGASGAPAAIVMPRIDAGPSAAADIFAAAYMNAIALYQSLNEKTPGVFRAIGALQFARAASGAPRLAKALSSGALPEGYARAQEDGLFFPQAGVLSPPRLIAALIGDARLIKQRAIKIALIDDGVVIDLAGGERVHAAAAIIANGLEALRFEQARGLPLSGAAGQIDWYEDESAPDRVVAFGPYAAPCPDPDDPDAFRGVVVGATFAPIAIGDEPRFSREAAETTRDALRARLPSLAAQLDVARARSRAAVRCATPDRIPICGPAPDWGFFAGAYDGLRTGARRPYPMAISVRGVHFLTGLGSRGFVTAPLCAQMIAATLAGAPAPLSREAAQALSPARFFIRDLKRARTVRPAR